VNVLFLAQRLLGFAAILFGVIILFSNILAGLIVAVAGSVLVSLAELVRMQQGTYHLALGLPYKNEQINEMIKLSQPMKVFSSGLTIHPHDDTAYPMLRLHGEYYLRAKAFVPYIEQQEMEYKFVFPDTEPVLLLCELRCRQGSNLFQFNEQVFVKLSALPLAIQMEGDKLRIEVKTSLAQL
jgi:hypothetical protein